MRPFFRAYLLGYGFTVGPRVLSLLVNHLLRLAPRRHKGADVQDASNHPRPQFTLLEALVKTLSAGASLNRFPTFCAALVGGSTLLEVCSRRRDLCDHIIYVDRSDAIIARPSPSIFSHLE